MPVSAPPTATRTVRGSGPGRLLAHGAAGGVEANFGPILEGLAAEHTVVGVDYPGSGQSPAASTSARTSPRSPPPPSSW